MAVSKAPKRLEVYYDSEFTGLHRDTTLISIGMYCPSLGAYFYAEFTDYDDGQVDSWIQNNVIGNLVLTEMGMDENVYIKDMGCAAPSVKVRGKSATIAEELLKWLHVIHDQSGLKIQIYSDCYAYDWMLLMDLICERGQAMSIPEFIDYIPVDLSTALQMAGVDPDVNREELAGDEWIQKIRAVKPFSTFGPKAFKHNSLWDAVVAYICFFNLQSGKKIADYLTFS